MMDLNKNKAKNSMYDKLPLVWTNIILFALLHVVGSYGIFILLKGNPKFYTIIFDLIFATLSQIGITAGAHRLWSHRSYKAKAPLRFLLVLFNTCVYENSIINWSRDHRGHHKFTDTDADPHNVNRGIFFSHIGWIMKQKHPDVIKKGKGIDLSDLYQDPFLRFQHKYYFVLMPIACFMVPVFIPMYFWKETFTNAFCINIVRYLTTVHNTLTINSIAHRFGYKPYDRFIRPGDNLYISTVTFGEGYHNYHHAFPWDYRSAEFGAFSFNITRSFIELCAKIGWAYDLKAASDEMVKSRVMKTGDGSHAIWGWGDKDQLERDIKTTIILNKEKGI